MDTSFYVTLLTLGVLLLLVGIVGQVKAKEIEVGTKNPLARVIIGAIGIVFIAFSLTQVIIPALAPTPIAVSGNTASPPTLVPPSPTATTPAPKLTGTPVPTSTDTPTTPPTDTSPPPTHTALPPTTPALPKLSFAEDCLPFDTNRVKLREDGGNWWVVDGGAMLYFGSNGTEAQQALNIILNYRMNDQCFVGRPDPSLEYWLVDNASPAGSYPNEDCLSFNLDNIQVVNSSGRWKIVDGNHSILDFAAVEDEAKRSYEILQFYRFDHICFVGRPDPSMTYFRQ